MTAPGVTAQVQNDTPTLPLLGAAMPSSEFDARRAWLTGRDLEIQDPVSHALLDGDWRAHAANVRARLRGHEGRLGVHGPFWSLTLTPKDPAIRKVVVDRLVTGLSFAAEIGATHMVIHSPFDCFGHPMVAHSPATDLHDSISLVHDTLAEVLPLARQLGCTLMIENIRDVNPAPLVALVRSFDSPNVRMSVDVGHATLMARLGGPSAAHWIREAGDLLGHVHLQDTDGLLDRHWAPGEGDINWNAVFRALREVGGTPRLILELRPDQLEQGANWLAAQHLGR